MYNYSLNVENKYANFDLSQPVRSNQQQTSKQGTELLYRADSKKSEQKDTVGNEK